MPVTVVPADHHEKLAALYRAGKTLAQIGAMYGVTRERVRQIIGKFGMAAKDGGVRVQSSARKSQRLAQLAARWNPRYERIYGCDYETVLRLNGARGQKRGTLGERYHSQRHCAAQRGIGWELSFPEWLVIWELSGHLHERGRGSGKYVMARKGDDGPYAVGNVYITTCNENARAYQSRRHGIDYAPPTNDTKAA